jgi:hypothetical protein
LSIVKNEVLAGGFDLIVVDEASAYKNAQTDRWKVLRDLNKVIKGLWMLTGTPAAQSPADAYGLAKLVNPTAVSPFFGQFKDTVMNKVSLYKTSTSIMLCECTQYGHECDNPSEIPLSTYIYSYT